jgi:hypothetical protein
VKKIISLAYYLPQFHEIPENNLWWGEAFTEWVNLRKAPQYFSWQKIRRPVAPFNEYSLLDTDVLEWQSRIATEHGITGFLIWDYWFGEGKQLLERPAELLLGKGLNFPYCFSWANHSWENKATHEMLQEQKYLGETDYTAYFYNRLPHFKSNNYIKVDGKPVFGVFLPQAIPDLPCFIRVFRGLAEKEGFPGIYLVAENATEESGCLFDRHLSSGSSFKRRKSSDPLQFIKEQLIKRYNFNALGPIVFDYKKTVLEHSKDALSKREIPVLFTGWDTTPRHKKRGTIYKGFTLEVFKANLINIVIQLKQQRAEHPIVVVKSWNEWAEGNLMEPDSVFGDGLLKIYKANIPSSI